MKSTNRNALHQKKQGKPRPDGAESPTSQMDRFIAWNPIFHYLILVCMVVVVYFQTASFGYSGFDDEALVKDHYTELRDVSRMRDVLSSDVFWGRTTVLYYRPFQVLSYMVDTILWGARPSGYHVSNVFLHGAMTCTLFYLLLVLGFDRLRAFFFAAVFALHPVFVQTVAWIPSRGDLLIAIFGAWSFILYKKYFDTGKPYYLLCLVSALLLAVFSKETAALIPLVLLAFSILTAKGKPAWGKIVLAAFVCIAVLGTWWYFRNKVITGSVDSGIVGLGPLLHNLQALPILISKFFFPFSLSPMPAFTTPGILIGAACIVEMLAAAVYWKRLFNPLFLFGLIWFLVLLFPGLLYRHELGANAYDYLTHRLYLPAVGLIISLLALFQGRKIIGGRWVVVAAAGLVLACGIASGMLAGNYANAEAFYAYSLATNPASALAHNNRGMARSMNGELPGALEDLSAAIALVPGYAMAHCNRGMVYEKLKSYANAEADYAEALTLNPAYADAYNNRGVLFTNTGKYRQAVNDLTKAIALKASFEEAYYNRGLACLRDGNLADAERDFTTAIRIKPLNPEAFNSRGMLKGLKGDTPGAVQDLDEALRLDPQYAEAYLNRGIAKEILRDNDGAIADYSQAVRFDPSNAQAFFNRGMLKLRSQDREGAHSDLVSAARLGDKNAEILLRQNFH